VTLAVHNGGPPIPPEVLPFVFEPLARGRAEGASHSIPLACSSRGPSCRHTEDTFT
jgi:nitrogen-specific signal transduction histidine kinase